MLDGQAAGFLSRVKKETPIKAPIITLYGTEGIGKTTLAAAMPRPLMLMFEDGLVSEDLRAIPNYTCTTFSDVGGICSELAQVPEDKRDFNTIVIDSLDAMEPYMVAEICARNNWSNLQAPGYGKGAIEFVDWTDEFMRNLVTFRNLTNIGIVLIAHDKTTKRLDPAVGEYTTYDLAFPDKAAQRIVYHSDAVLFGCRPVQLIKEANKGMPGKSMTRGVMENEHRLFTRAYGFCRAKNRYGMPPDIPMSVDALASYIPWLQNR